MTPNEYRLNGMEHWVRFGRGCQWYGDLLRLPYRAPFGLYKAPLSAFMSDPEPMHQFEYRRDVKEFRTPQGRWLIKEIDMLLHDGKTWENIERRVDAYDR